MGTGNIVSSHPFKTCLPRSAAGKPTDASVGEEPVHSSLSQQPMAAVEVVGDTHDRTEPKADRKTAGISSVVQISTSPVAASVSEPERKTDSELADEVALGHDKSSSAYRVPETNHLYNEPSAQASALQQYNAAKQEVESRRRGYDLPELSSSDVSPISMHLSIAMITHA